MSSQWTDGRWMLHGRWNSGVNLLVWSDSWTSTPPSRRSPVSSLLMPGSSRVHRWGDSFTLKLIGELESFRWLFGATHTSGIGCISNHLNQLKHLDATPPHDTKLTYFPTDDTNILALHPRSAHPGYCAFDHFWCLHIRSVWLPKILMSRVTASK